MSSLVEMAEQMDDASIISTNCEHRAGYTFWIAGRMTTWRYT